MAIERQIHQAKESPMKSGLLLTLKILVPYDPGNLDSITAAAAAAKKLQAPDELAKIVPPGVEIISAKSEPYRSRDPKKAVVAPAVAQTGSASASNKI